MQIPYSQRPSSQRPRSSLFDAKTLMRILSLIDKTSRDSIAKTVSPRAIILNWTKNSAETMSKNNRSQVRHPPTTGLKEPRQRRHALPIPSRHKEASKDRLPPADKDPRNNKLIAATMSHLCSLTSSRLPLVKLVVKQEFSSHQLQESTPTKRLCSSKETLDLRN